jgi:hypothetical protein
MLGLLTLLVMVIITASVPARGVWWCEEDQETRTFCCCVSWTLSDAGAFPAMQPRCCELIDPVGAVLITGKEATPKITAKSLVRHPGDLVHAPTRQAVPLTAVVRDHGRIGPSRPIYLRYCSLQT